MVLCEPRAHLLAGRRRVFVQQGLGRDHKAGGAKSALCSPVHDKSLLDDVQFFGRADSLDSDYLGAVSDAFHFRHARESYLAVENYRAGTAVPIIA